MTQIETLKLSTSEQKGEKQCKEHKKLKLVRHSNIWSIEHEDLHFFNGAKKEHISTSYDNPLLGTHLLINEKTRVRQ